MAALGSNALTVVNVAKSKILKIPIIRTYLQHFWKSIIRFSGIIYVNNSIMSA